MGRKTMKRRSGKTAVAGKDFRLAEEIDYIQSRAAERDGRLVTVGPLVLFSTETGDAWLLDPRITWPRGIPNQSTSRTPTLLSRSSGRDNTTSREGPSSTSMVAVAG